MTPRLRTSALLPVLHEADRMRIKCLIAAIAPQAQVWIFGSRATGHARPFSDLDLLVESQPPLSWDQRAALADAFEQSPLPFRVDVVEPLALAPMFRSRAWSECIPL